MWAAKGGGGFGALLSNSLRFISQDVLLQSSFEKQKIVAFTAVSANSKTSEHWKDNCLILSVNKISHHFSIVKATSRKFFHVLLWEMTYSFVSFLWEILTHIDLEEAAGRGVITMNLEYLLSRSSVNILSCS